MRFVKLTDRGREWYNKSTTGKERAMRDYVPEYTCVPKQDKIKSGMLVSGCIAAAIGMLAVSETGGILAPYFKWGALVWVLIGALFALRLLSVGYVYAIFRNASSGELDLVINEIRFGNSKTVCRVSLFDIKEAIDYDSSRKEFRGKRKKRQRRVRPNRKKYGKGRYYNYCVDIIPSKYCLLHISGNDGAYIKFSPDETMTEIITANRIK